MGWLLFGLIVLWICWRPAGVPAREHYRQLGWSVLVCGGLVLSIAAGMPVGLALLGLLAWGGYGVWLMIHPRREDAPPPRQLHRWDCPCGAANAPQFVRCRSCGAPVGYGRPVYR